MAREEDPARAWCGAEGVTPMISREGPGGMTRWGPAVAGIGGPALFATVTAAMGRARPGYDPVRQHISDLGVGPYAWLQNASVVLLGVLVIVFARGFHQSVDRGRGSPLGPWLLAGFGLGAVLIGLFPQGPGDGRGGNFLIHSAAFWGCVASLLLAAMLLPRRLRQDRRWHGCGRWSVVCAVVALCLLAAPLLAGPGLLAGWGGLLERLLAATGLGWLELLAVRLLVLTATEAPVRVRLVPRAWRGRAPRDEGVVDAGGWGAMRTSAP